MISTRSFSFCAATVAMLLLTNCANHRHVTQIENNQGSVNPYPVGTYEHFKADPSYPKTKKVWTNEALLARTNPGNSHIKIELSTQRGFLMNNGEIVIDYPICSGIESRPTPTGTFYILEKVVDKKSNRYGRFYDASGECVNSNADLVLDKLPEGGRFEGANMHYWMRLTYDGVGHHIGPVLRHPASHACVRGPSDTLPTVYSKIKEGTRVDIE